MILAGAASSSAMSSGVSTGVSAGAGAGAGISGAGLAMGGMVAIQASQAYFGAKAQASMFKVQEYKYETESKLAKMSGNFRSMQLQRDFNNTMASNAVMAAAQGRRGGSVEAIGSAAESQLNWDMEFSELSRDIQTKGLDSMAVSSSKASSSASRSAIGEAASTGLLGAAKYYTIKG